MYGPADWCWSGVDEIRRSAEQGLPDRCKLDVCFEWLVTKTSWLLLLPAIIVLGVLLGYQLLLFCCLCARLRSISPLPLWQAVAGVLHCPAACNCCHVPWNAAAWAATTGRSTRLGLLTNCMHAVTDCMHPINILHLRRLHACTHPQTAPTNCMHPPTNCMHPPLPECHPRACYRSTYNHPLQCRSPCPCQQAGGRGWRAQHRTGARRQQQTRSCSGWRWWPAAAAAAAANGMQEGPRVRVVAASKAHAAHMLACQPECSNG